MDSLGTKLKDARKELKLSQEKFSEIVGINRSMLARYETDAQVPNIDILVRIADALNCSIDWLLGRTNVRNFSANPAEVEEVVQIADNARILPVKEPVEIDPEVLQSYINSALDDAVHRYFKRVVNDHSEE